MIFEKIPLLGPIIKCFDLVLINNISRLVPTPGSTTIINTVSFGNAITNVPIRNDFIKGTALFLKHDSSIKIEFGDQSYMCRYVTHFGSVPINMLTLLKGSTNFLEIAKNQANAAKEIGFNVGDIITLNL